ncbi:MAG TPA: pilus assembly protein CpaE, partial [Herbaspirillum sp.]|nr:pilus assembly protein CpaE [Herbaspirillum sp.]
QHGSLIALLGARAGIGTTTLAVHLADFLRRQKIAGRDECRVALLDLGWPAGDGQLYLNVSGHFHFTDVVNNRQRLDQTLIQTALAHSQSGIGVISLPRALRWMDDLNDADMVVALTLLRSYFDVLVMDLGGLPDPALAIRMAAAADKTWLLSDQSTGSLVSLAALIAESDRQGAQRMAERRLIVNRYDKQYGMSAEQIAGRFQLELIAAIPDRTAALMDSANQGKLLHQVAGNDPYLEALAKLAEEIPGVTVKRSGIGALSSWLSGTLFEKQRAAWQK